jgi:hypothetical protein
VTEISIARLSVGRIPSTQGGRNIGLREATWWHAKSYRFQKRTFTHARRKCGLGNEGAGGGGHRVGEMGKTIVSQGWLYRDKSGFGSRGWSAVLCSIRDRFVGEVAGAVVSRTYSLDEYKVSMACIMITYGSTR